MLCDISNTVKSKAKLKCLHSLYVALDSTKKPASHIKDASEGETQIQIQRLHYPATLSCAFFP